MWALEDIVREGARRMLQAALESEVEEYIQRLKSLVNKDGNRLVARNGYLPKRPILTGGWPVPVTRPCVDDRALVTMGKERFTSRLLPRFMRRAPNIDTLIPVLYLKGKGIIGCPVGFESSCPASCVPPSMASLDC